MTKDNERNAFTARLYGVQPKFHTPSSTRLKFVFNASSPVGGMWCVQLYENLVSWHDNYLCTNRDIGLVWTLNHWGYGCDTNYKCTRTIEPSVAAFQDNALCLPVQSNIELVWSYCSKPRLDWDCVLVYDPSSDSSMNDNYLCYKEH